MPDGTFAMGAYENAVVSRRMFKERKRYHQMVQQAGVPVVDADWNDWVESIWTQMRRLIENAVGDGALGVAFQITERVVATVLQSNDFIIRGGISPDFGPEILFVRGVQADLFENDAYLVGRETAPFVTGLASTTLFDATAHYVPGELVGKDLIPDIRFPLIKITVLANTENSITISPSFDLLTMTAVNRRYRIGLTTPSADRKDLVVLNVFLAETTSEQDPTLTHSIGGIPVQAALRFRVEEIVEVYEGLDDPLVVPTGYTDSNGNRHVLIPLARFSREGGNDKITNPMIEDLRRKIFRLDEIDDRFVNSSGDTMTGDLTMAPGTQIHGDCIIGSAEICPEAVEQRHLSRFTHLLGEIGIDADGSPINDVPTEAPEVHDNRYLTRSEVLALIGKNLVINSDFSKGFRGWKHSSPLPLFARPFEEAARCVRVGPRKCGGDCCCGGASVFMQSGCRVCEVCVAAQEVRICSAGDDFTIVMKTEALHGDDAYRPFVKMLMYSATCNFIGTKTVRVTDRCLTKDDGCVRVAKRIKLPAAVDRIEFFPCIEVFPRRPGNVGEGEEPFVADCAIAEPGFEVLICVAQIRKQTRVEDEESVEDTCRFRDQISILRCSETGEIEILPIEGQKTTIIEHNPNVNGHEWDCGPNSCSGFEPIKEQETNSCECFEVCCPPCPPITPLNPGPGFIPEEAGLTCFLETREPTHVISGQFSMSFGPTTPATPQQSSLGTVAARVVSPAQMAGVTAVKFRFKAYQPVRLCIGAVDTGGGQSASVMTDFVGPGTTIGSQGTLEIPYPGPSITGPGTANPLLPTFTPSLVQKFCIGIAERSLVPSPVPNPNPNPNPGPGPNDPVVTIDEIICDNSTLIDNFDSYALPGAPPGLESFNDKWTCSFPFLGIVQSGLPAFGECPCPPPSFGITTIGLFFPFSKPGISLKRVFSPAKDFLSVVRVETKAIARAATYLVRIILKDSVGKIAVTDVLVPKAADPCTVGSWVPISVKLVNFDCIGDIDLTAITELHFFHIFPEPGLPALCYAPVFLIKTVLGSDVPELLEDWTTVGAPGFPWSLVEFFTIPQCPDFLESPTIFGEVVDSTDPDYDAPPPGLTPPDGFSKYLALKLPGTTCITRAAFNILVPLAPFVTSPFGLAPIQEKITVWLYTKNATSYERVKLSFIMGEPDHKVELFVENGSIPADTWTPITFLASEFRLPVDSPTFSFAVISRIFVEFRKISRTPDSFDFKRALLLGAIKFETAGGTIVKWFNFEALSTGDIPFPPPPGGYPVGVIIQSAPNQPVGWKEPIEFVPGLPPTGPGEILIQHDQWEPQAVVRIFPSGNLVAVEGWRLAFEATTAAFTSIRNAFVRLKDNHGNIIATVPLTGPYSTVEPAGDITFVEFGLTTNTLRDGSTGAVGVGVATALVKKQFVSRPLPQLNNQAVVIEILSGVLTDLGLKLDGATTCWTKVGTVFGYGAALADVISPPVLVAPDGDLFKAALQEWLGSDADDALAHLQIIPGGSNELFLPTPIVECTIPKIATPLGDALSVGYYQNHDGDADVSVFADVVIASPATFRPIVQIKGNSRGSIIKSSSATDGMGKSLFLKVAVSMIDPPDPILPTSVSIRVTQEVEMVGDITINCTTNPSTTFPAVAVNKVTTPVKSEPNHCSKLVTYDIPVSSFNDPDGPPKMKVKAQAGALSTELEIVLFDPALTVLKGSRITLGVCGDLLSVNPMRENAFFQLYSQTPLADKDLQIEVEPILTLATGETKGAGPRKPLIFLDPATNGQRAVLVPANLLAPASPQKKVKIDFKVTSFSEEFFCTGTTGPVHFGDTPLDNLSPEEIVPFPNIVNPGGTVLLAQVPAPFRPMQLPPSGVKLNGAAVAFAVVGDQVQIMIPAAQPPGLVSVELTTAIGELFRTFVAVIPIVLPPGIPSIVNTPFPAFDELGLQNIPVETFGTTIADLTNAQWSVFLPSTGQTFVFLNVFVIDATHAIINGPWQFFPPGSSSALLKFVLLGGTGAPSNQVPVLVNGGFNVGPGSHYKVLSRDVSDFLWRNWTEVRLGVKPAHGSVIVAGTLVDEDGRTARLVPQAAFSGDRTLLSWRRDEIVEFEDGFKFAGTGTHAGIIRIRFALLPTIDAGNVTIDVLDVVEQPVPENPPIITVLDSFLYNSKAAFLSVWRVRIPFDERNEGVDILAVEDSREYREDPVVGMFGFGDPETGARFGKLAFRTPPPEGCRNVWVDYAYADSKECLGVPVRKRELEFHPDVCGCVPTPVFQDIADFVTDPAMRAILPDDGFGGLPEDAMETIDFEYCDPATGLVRKFGSQHPSPFGMALYGGGGRPDPTVPVAQDLWIKVWLGKGSANVSEREQKLVRDLFLFDATEGIVKVAPGGTTGFAPGLPVWLANCAFPNNPRREIYCCDCDNAETGSALFELVTPAQTAIPEGVKAASIAPMGLFAVAMERDGDGLPWVDLFKVRFLIKTPSSLIATVVLTDASLKHAKASIVISAMPTVQAIEVGPFVLDPGFDLSTVSKFKIVLSGIGLEAGRILIDFIRMVAGTVGFPEFLLDSFETYATTTAMKEVWTFFAVESAEICGVYGTVTEVLPMTNEIKVEFPAPVTAAFKEELKAEIMVSPPGAMGFYWEASPALVELAAQLPDFDAIFIKWGFRFWQARLSGCKADPFQPPAEFVDNGNGVERVYEIPGDNEKNVIDPSKWADMWCSPINEHGLLLDAPGGSTVLKMCAPEIFGPCDVIGIRDHRFLGLPYYGGVCAIDRVNKMVILSRAIPFTFQGWEDVFDGFKLSGQAAAYRHVAVGYKTRSITLLTHTDGTPKPPGFWAGVDYKRGRVVFPWDTPADRVRVCYVASRAKVQLPCLEGSYRLIPVDFTGCVGAPSELIRVRKHPTEACAPTTFFGTVKDSFAVPLPFGTPVVVRINGKPCAFGGVVDDTGRYFVTIPGWQDLDGCGEDGIVVQIFVDGTLVDEDELTCGVVENKDLVVP